MAQSLNVKKFVDVSLSDYTDVIIFYLNWNYDNES